MAQRGVIQGQIFLDSFNPILENAIKPRLMEGKREPCELKVSDFDDVMYTVEVPPNSLSTLSLSIAINGWDQISSNGGSEMLAAKYQGMVSPQVRPGHNLTITTNLDSPTVPAEQLLKSLTELKRNLMAAPFDRAFDALREGRGGSVPPAAIPWRKNEVVYVVPQADRVTVIFAIDFTESDERAIAKSFLMEFVDAQRVANNSPPCTFTPDAPLELKSMPMPPSHTPVGFLSFVIFPQHVDRGRQEKTITLLTGFRNYLHYHLKATKTYMHMRMRKRVVGLLQVLNRAVPEEEAKAKKTAKGRTFNRG
ncbi:unnamed protein product [Ectocarpus sp. 6 AP-2014]